MSINISVHGSPVSIRRRKLYISDIETLKKNEINRRRRLRLEQVRQQSKDIANQIRHRIRGEKDKQLSNWEEKQRTELNKHQAHRLLTLQQQYQDCLDEIGMGHLEAALEPDPEIILEAERERIRALAEERGREAAAKLRKDLAEAEEKKNAAKKQQQFSRTIENIRSSVIVSLGKSMKRTPRKSKGKKKKKKPLHEITDNVPEKQQPPPPKSWTIPFDEVTKDTELYRTDDETTPPTAPEVSEDVDSSESSSESSSEDNLIISGSSSSSSSISTGGTNLHLQQSRVHFYDHGNRHESEYEHSAVVERIEPHTTEPDANEAAEIESQKSGGTVLGQASYRRTYSRGNQALARERLHRDYKQLLGDLHILAREERLIRGTREHGLPPEIFYEDYRRKEFDNRRQRNMDSAFESIYHRSQMDSPVAPESPADAIPAQPQWERADQDDTPAKLNVADYHKKSPVDMLNVHTAIAQSSASAVPGVSTALTSEQAAMSETPEPSAAHVSDQRTPSGFTYHVYDPAPDSSLATGQTTSYEPATSAYRLDSLEELIDRVKAQQTLILDEIRGVSEISDSHPPIKDPSTATDEANHRHQETFQDIADSEEKKDDENSLKSKSDVKEAAKHDKRKKEDAKILKPCTVCKCKKRDSRRKEEKPAKKVDEVICKSDSSEMDHSDNQLTEVHSEYSYERSVVESSSASGSTSYEGVKIVVSVSELAEKLYRSPRNSKVKNIVSVKSPQKVSKHYDHIKKICKKRHKTPEGQLIGPEKEYHVDKDSKCKSPRKLRKQEKGSRDVREKGTMTTDFEFSLPDRNKPEERTTSDEVMKPVISKTDISKIDGDKSWKEVLEKSTSSKKNSTTESTTYMSPPEQLVSSNIEHIASLLAAVKKRKTHKMNPLLIHYISRLLAMSRESIENLGMSSSEISTPSSAGSVSMRLAGHQDPSNGDAHLKQKTDTLPRPCKAQVQQVPGTSTPQEEEPDQLTRSNQHSDILTPPFESNLKDITLEEYKAMKFPDIFPEYSKRCSRISNLAKRIEQIRDEQRRLMSTLSTSNSSSGSGQDNDSTKYISPPESITIMTRLGRKGSVPQSQPIQPDMDMSGRKENAPLCISHTSGQCLNTCHGGATNLGGREEQNGARLQNLSNEGSVCSSQYFYITPPESTSTMFNNNNNGNIASTKHTSVLNQELAPPPLQSTSSHDDRTTVPQPSVADQSGQDISGTYLQGVCGLCPQDNTKKCDPNKCLISREPRPHTRPPSTSIRRNFQSDTNNIPPKELSTIVEGDSSLTSVGRDQHVAPADTSDDSLPDVLSEMLSRKLITSPPSWLRTEQDNSSSTSHSSRNVHDSIGSEVNYLTYIGQKSEELCQIFREGFRNITSNVDLPRLIIDVFSRLGKNPSEIEIDQAFKKIGLRWCPNNENQISPPALTNVDVTSQIFRDQVYKFFKGLTLDSPLLELENAFQKIGITYPNASLKRNNNGKSVSFSSSTAGSSSGSTATGSALLPSVPTSISVSTENLSSSQDVEPSS